MPTITHIHETCIYGSDLRAMEQFYSTVLGLTKIHDAFPRGITFRVSPDNVLLIFDPAESSKPHETVPSHGPHGPGHVAFGCPDGDLDGWRAALAARGVEIEREVRWSAAWQSIYFRDPAGNSVEIMAGDAWSDGP